MRPKPCVLAILDGWGVAPDTEGNAITRAKLPHMQQFMREYPTMTILASGNEVGLSFGEMGNSEVGHLNIGAGRVYYQTFPRINKDISDGSFFEKSVFIQAADHIRKQSSALHVIGLVSTGNVHAALDHCFAVLEFAKRQKIKKVYVHAVLDGRDALYNSGLGFVKTLEEKMKELKIGAIASLSGRYYAMDRDNRWDRVEKAYHAMVGTGPIAPHAQDAIQASYDKQVFDEEFEPITIGKGDTPLGPVRPGDACIFFNFRSDRARELTKAFVLPAFEKFPREYMRDICFVTMTEYEKEIPVLVAYPPEVVYNSFAQVISVSGLKQIHVAETEKYAHVTFFLNGTVEDPFPGEDRDIIPSPKVASYDLAPEMSAKDVGRSVVSAIEKGEYDVIICNFANADMVGHTGDLKATIRGCEAVDAALGDIAEHILAKNGVFFITADHGNAEEVINLQTGEKDKEHSNNSVPFIIISNGLKGQAGPSGDPPNGDLSLLPPVGMLADVAPTVLKFLEIPQPPEMTGRALM